MAAYNRIIRKITLAFGDLFSNINCIRYNPDLTEEERFLVPIEYATKELYVRRLSDPDLNKKVQITLPRMSYELTGLNYDSSRKQITNYKQFYPSGTGATQQYMPVPYDFDFSLYLYVRNIEDANQIIEHIRNSHAYQEITCHPMVDLPTTKNFVYEGDKIYVSIDIIKANYSIMKKYDPTHINDLGDSYEDLLAKFNVHPIFNHSKGFSARKLTAFAFSVTAIFAHVKWILNCYNKSDM